MNSNRPSKTQARRPLLLSISLLLALLTSLLCGCASNPDKIQAAYVSPLKYQNYDCDQIAMEMDYIGQRTNRLYQSLKKENTADKWQMGVGLILFWPTLFALEGGDGPEATEYAQLKGEFDALRSTSVQKKCGYEDRTFKSTVATAAEQDVATQDVAAVSAAGTNSTQSVSSEQTTQTTQIPSNIEQPRKADDGPADQSLNGYVGQWFMALTIEQGRRRAIALDESEMIMADTDMISWIGKSNDVDFIIRKNPESDDYLFTYSYTATLASKPALRMTEVPLKFSSSDGFSGSRFFADDNIMVDISIKRIDDGFTCLILGNRDGEKLFSHRLGFSEADSKDSQDQVTKATPESTVYTVDAGEEQTVESVSETKPASVVVADSPKPGVTTVTGVLVDENGAPVEGQRIEILFGERYAMKIDENGYLLNPSCKSDEHGRFELEVTRAKFTEEELADIRFANSIAPLRYEDGAIMSLNIVAGDTHLDLGQITVER